MAKTLIERMLASTLNRGVRCCGGLNTYRQCSGCPQVEAHKQALAAEALIECIEHMNSAEGSHLAFTCLNRRSYESRLVVRALKKLRAADSGSDNRCIVCYALTPLDAKHCGNFGCPYPHAENRGSNGILSSTDK